MYYHATPSTNLAAIRRDGLLPRLGRRARLIGETDAAVYLFAQADMLDDAIAGWLGDALEEDGIDSVAVLAVDIAAAGLAVHTVQDGFSHTCSRRIAPDHIRLLRHEPLEA